MVMWNNGVTAHTGLGTDFVLHEILVHLYGLIVSHLYLVQANHLCALQWLRYIIIIEDEEL